MMVQHHCKTHCMHLIKRASDRLAKLVIANLLAIAVYIYDHFRGDRMIIVVAITFINSISLNNAAE